MIHQGGQPARGLHRSNGAISQRIADHAVQRVVAVIDCHAFIKSNQIGGAAACPQILDDMVIEFDSHRNEDGVTDSMLTVRIFLQP